MNVFVPGTHKGFNSNYGSTESSIFQTHCTPVLQFCSCLPQHSLKKQESDAGLKEEEALRQFKEKISDLITSQDDYSLKKWLQGEK